MFLWTRSSLTILPKTFRQEWIHIFAHSEKTMKKLDISQKNLKTIF